MYDKQYELRKTGRSRAVCAGLSLALCLTLAPATLNTTTGSFDMSVAVAAQTLDGTVMRGLDTTAISGDAFDVASVLGLEGNTLYADVLVGGKVKSQDITYAYSKSTDQAGVVQLETTKDVVAKNSGNLTLSFYANKTSERNGESPVYTANLYAVCMTVDGEKIGSVEDTMVGIRTSAASDAARSFTAPRLIVRDGQTYRLKSSSTSAVPTLEDGVLYVDYEKVSAAGVAASVTYVDQDGNVIYTDAVGTLADGESKTVGVLSTVESGSKVYVPLASAAAVTVSAANPEVTIHCVERKAADRATSKVSIKYVDADGKQLMADSVEVSSGGYNYAAPTTFSQSRDGSVARYVLTGAVDNRGNTYTADEAKALSFTYDGATEYTLTYGAEAVQLTFTVNVAFVSPDANGNLTVAVDASQTKSAQFSEGNPATIELPATIEKDGYTYNLAGSDSTLTYSWEDFQAGALTTDTAYYTRSDVVAPEAYDVTVRYVDAETGTVLSTQTMTSTPDGGALSIQGPETLDVDGVSYVRLSGQEAALTHRFYAPYRTYTIYYAKAGSQFAGDTTITRTVVTDGGTTTYNINTDGGSTSTSGTGLVDTAPYTTVVTVVEVADDAANANASNASNSRNRRQEESEVISPDGEDLSEESISDDGNPLARAFAKGGIGWVVSAIAGILALILLLLFFIAKRRKNDEEEA